VHAINEALGGRGSTFDLVEPAAYPATSDAPLDELIADMREGRVDTLLMLDVNPAYAAPAALGFSDALKRVLFSVTIAPTADETTRKTSWFVPLAHSFETWSDARAYDGTATILQPQALPLYGGWSTHRLLGLLLDPSPASALDLVQETWRARFGDAFEQSWHDALAGGVVAGTASARSDVSLRGDVSQLATPAPADRAITVLFRPDPHLWDGRYANNAWLQELPRPLTKLTWDNPLLISPALARKMQLKNGDLAELAVGAQTLRLPVWTMPGQAAGCVTALMGFGRDQVGSVGQGVGYDVQRLMGSDGPATLRKVEGSAVLACTDHHNLVFDRAGEFVRHGPLTEFIADPRFLENKERQPSLYRMKPPGPAAWAMSIDLNACIGCNACVIACQAENNIPVVGKEQVVHEREMHWLRIDRYYEGTPDAPESFFQPMLCMHCEQAPCEVVCPVGATVHDTEGLNVMVYNRCVGTRFCSNNCPYKVRRFNYFDFAKQEHRPPAARNPDVSVRARGVMEKCTFCLQRIAQARIIADRDNQPLPEVRTACQAACPTQAFTFGNMADPESMVAKRKQSPLDYALLDNQNTRPRVTYEARIENRNPAIGEGRT